MADWKELAQKPEEWKTLRYDDPRLDAFANEVEQRLGLPTGILEAIKNAGERTNPGLVSPAGAKGIMQFIDSTRRDYQHNVNDPFESIQASGEYIRDLLKHKDVGGDPLAAIAWYNGGAAAARAVRQRKAPPAKETRDYIARIREYMEKKYGGGD